MEVFFSFFFFPPLAQKNRRHYNILLSSHALKAIRCFVFSPSKCTLPSQVTLSPFSCPEFLPRSKLSTPLPFLLISSFCYPLYRRFVSRFRVLAGYLSLHRLQLFPHLLSPAGSPPPVPPILSPHGSSNASFTKRSSSVLCCPFLPFLHQYPPPCPPPYFCLFFSPFLPLPLVPFMKANSLSRAAEPAYVCVLFIFSFGCQSDPLPWFFFSSLKRDLPYPCPPSINLMSFFLFLSFEPSFFFSLPQRWSLSPYVQLSFPTYLFRKRLPLLVFLPLFAAPFLLPSFKFLFFRFASNFGQRSYLQF